MKRILLFIILTTICLGVFAGCGANKPEFYTTGQDSTFSSIEEVQKYFEENEMIISLDNTTGYYSDHSKVEALKEKDEVEYVETDVYGRRITESGNVILEDRWVVNGDYATHEIKYEYVSKVDYSIRTSTTEHEFFRDGKPIISKENVGRYIFATPYCLTYRDNKILIYNYEKDVNYEIAGFDPVTSEEAKELFPKLYIP